MDSICYCFLCDGELNTFEEWNAHLNVNFLFFSVKNDFSTFSTFFKLMFVFSV